MTKLHIFDTIRQDLSQNEVVVYMKGTKAIPQCGFSAVVANILTTLGVEFQSFNILEDDLLRQGIKDFSSWPTIPQLYVKGEFIGGCDLVREMYQTGELHDILKEKGIPFRAQADCA